MRALGSGEPPGTVIVGGESYQLDNIFKHDSWAATALYVHPDGRTIVCKFNRTQSIFGIPMRWLGRSLARREADFLRRLADVELIPKDLGPVMADGQPLTNAIARSFVDGRPFSGPEQIGPTFFQNLKGLVAAMHAHDIAYVDFHKRENIVIATDGRPYLVDFQVSFGLSRRWPGNGRLARYVLAQLQEMDNYHLQKHIARCQPDLLPPELRGDPRPPAIIRAHRRVSVPLRTLRRRLLVLLRVRHPAASPTPRPSRRMLFRPSAKPPRNEVKS